MATNGDILGWLESAIAVAQKYRHVIGAAVGDRQIRLAVAIKVPHRHRLRINAYHERCCRQEGPVAVAQQHGDAVGPIVGDH